MSLELSRPPSGQGDTDPPLPGGAAGAARSVTGGADGRGDGGADGRGDGGADGRADGPLLADAAGLRTNWQRLQAGFVDDPRGAVADAAGLVEHAAQALVGALRQRQGRLREMWDDGAPGDGGPADTEQLRLVLLRYRALFNQICRP